MAKAKTKKTAAKKPRTKSSSTKRTVKKNTKAKSVSKPKASKKTAAKKKAGKVSTAKKIVKKKISSNGKATPKAKARKSKKSKYTAKELKFFKQIIINERKQILESAKANMEALVDYESGEYVGDNSTYSTHMAEQGTDEMEREKNYMFVQRDEKYLGYLNDALIRIDNGTYGICINCKNLIPKERLELVPVTQHCIECKMLKG